MAALNMRRALIEFLQKVDGVSPENPSVSVIKLPLSPLFDYCLSTVHRGKCDDGVSVLQRGVKIRGSAVPEQGQS